MPCARGAEVFFDRHWSPKFANVHLESSQPDIVVVHGLDSHRLTWRIQGEEGEVGAIWLEDVLRRDLPRAKIMSFCPTSDAASWTLFTAGGLKAHGIELLKSICEERDRDNREQSSIIFIVSGMGSLIVQKALLIAQDNDLFESIRNQTSKIISVNLLIPAIDFTSRETLALNIMAPSIERCRYSLSRTIEMFSVAITDIFEGFFSVAARYQIVAEVSLPSLEIPSGEDSCVQRSHSKLKSTSDETEDRMLMISDNIRSIAKSGSTSRGKWYSDYHLMLSQIHSQQYTCKPVREHPQTLNWLLSHDIYIAWLKCSDPCMLYIHGQSGVGKTSLSSFLWKSLQTVGQAREEDASTTLYFSFDRADRRRKSTKSLLSSLIYQLLACRPPIFLSILLHFDWIQRSWHLTVEELWIILRSLVSYPIHEGIICIIDAIDQCDSALDTMLQDFLAFSASREANFKVVATSSMSPENLHHSPLFRINLDLQKEIGRDLEASTKIHVRDLVQANPAFLESEKDIFEEFQRRGTHLEVTLGIESLKSTRLRSTPWSIRETLQSLRWSPSDICDHILNEAAELPTWACTALCWLAHAFRPLTSNELSVAVAIRETTTSYSEIDNDVPHNIASDLKQIFGGIISVSYDEIRFVHRSIKDCLLISLTSPRRDRLSSGLTHSDLAKRCLTYLSLADLEDGSQSERVKVSSREFSPPGVHDFLGYATEYWPEHYQEAEGTDHLRGDVLGFLENTTPLERCYIHRPLKHPAWKRRPHPNSSLQIAAELGLTEIVTILLSKQDGNTFSQKDKEAALELAVENGHVKAATELLRHGTTSSRALSLAARHGSAELVRQLIHETHLKAVEIDGASDTDGPSPLHIAALRGQTDVISTLLKAGSTPGPINTFKDSPFSLAVKGGQVKALQQLLEADNTVALTDNTDFSLLHLAAMAGHIDIVRDLIRRGAEPNAIGKNGSTPLLLAAEGGHVVLVRDLIENFGADLIANEAGSCAVHVAAVNGHIRAFEQLCKAGADIKAKDKEGSQPIHLAASRGHLGVTKSLLELGVDPNTVNGGKLTSLHLATKGGHLMVVQELLNHSRSDVKIGRGPELKSRAGTGVLYDNAENESKDYEASEDDGDVWVNDYFSELPDSTTVEISSEHFDDSADESFDASDDIDDSSNTPDIQDSNEATPLHSAAVRGYVDIVRELLKANAQCNIRGKHHLTPLHLAAKEGYLSVVKELLQHKADPNITDINKSSALHAASIAGNLSMVKALLSFGADVSKTDDKQLSPLHHAATRGYIDVVNQLLEAKAELEAANAIGKTPLHIAVSQRHSDVVAALLEKGANPNMKSRQGWTALHFAVGGGHIETGLIVQILKGGADIDASTDSGSTPLFLAAESGSEAAVRLLLEAGAKADAKNKSESTPLHRAAQDGHLAVIRLLMKAGANPLAKKRSGVTPLQLALEDDEFDVAVQLLEPTDAELPSIDDYEESLYSLARVGFEKGVAKVLEYPLCNLERGDSNYQQSPLSHAAENGHEKVVQMLLDKGADPDSVDQSGRTPLSWAVFNEHEVVAKQLLQKNADIHSKDHEGWTALHFAVQNRNVHMVKLLLDEGADVLATFRGMNTSLYLAVYVEEPTLVRLLVDNGASVSIRNSDQQSPLDYAVMHGSVSTIELLLDLGASLFARSPDGWTAMHYAMNSGDDSIMGLLARRHSETYAGQEGWTGLHVAAISGYESLVREQLEQGADRTVRDRNGLMALHWAAARGHEDVVQLLLEMNTEVQAKDNEGMTPLHHAASGGNVGIVKALLEKGAERDVADLHGWTPLEIAGMYANDDVRDTLLGDNESTMLPETLFGLAPSRWVKAIESSNIRISEDGLMATGDQVDELEPTSRLQIRADQPMPAGAYTFYFEIVIVNAGRNNIVGIGFCEGHTRWIGMPGWYNDSWGYHGDDGKIFHNSYRGPYGTGVPYGPLYGTGDVVGCGVDFKSKTAFFTKNGEKLDTAFTGVKGRLYPMVGIGYPEIEVTVNFGQKDFVFQDLPLIYDKSDSVPGLGLTGSLEADG